MPARTTPLTLLFCCVSLTPALGQTDPAADRGLPLPSDRRSVLERGGGSPPPPPSPLQRGAERVGERIGREPVGAVTVDDDTVRYVFDGMRASLCSVHLNTFYQRISRVTLDQPSGSLAFLGIFAAGHYPTPMLLAVSYPTDWPEPARVAADVGGFREILGLGSQLVHAELLEVGPGGGTHSVSVTQENAATRGHWDFQVVATRGFARHVNKSLEASSDPAGRDAQHERGGSPRPNAPFEITEAGGGWTASREGLPDTPSLNYLELRTHSPRSGVRRSGPTAPDAAETFLRAVLTHQGEDGLVRVFGSTAAPEQGAADQGLASRGVLDALSGLQPGDD